MLFLKHFHRFFDIYAILEKKHVPSLEWLSGGGEIASLIRSLDWSKTPLGPIESWPQSLRTTVSLCLSSNFPINIIWGPEAIQIYNAGYAIICGNTHPRATGESYSATWASAWPVIGEPFERARRGETSYFENQRMFLERNGYLEETFFTYSLSPIRDETGGVAGLFHPVTETTATMLSERRTRTIRDISNKASCATTIREASQLIVKTLVENPRDLPFISLYLLEPAENKVFLLGQIGVPNQVSIAFETALLSNIKWTSGILQSDRPKLIFNLEKSYGKIPCGEYPEATQHACLLPIRASGQERPIGVIVTGLSTRLPMNDAYLSFLELLGSSISASINNARAYEEGKKRADELAAIDQAKTAFFSNVSHEFRTPLTLMLGPLEDSLRDPVILKNPEILARQELIHRNAKRLLKLVNTLLEFSRLEAGRMQAHYINTDLPKLTQQLAGMFRSTIERGGLKFFVETRALSAPAYVDRQMWEKIVLNLLSNAFKFTHQGEVRVLLYENRGKVVLEVSDTGTGIPKCELSRVFERFHRIASSKGRSYEGTGIGLALIYELVKLHGGMTRVESTIGKGSTFVVEIPLTKSHLNPHSVFEDLRDEEIESLSDSFVTEASSWTERNLVLDYDSEVDLPNTKSSLDFRYKILVADDNADMRGYIYSILESKFDLRLASDGQEALEAIIESPPDIILVDGMMPRLDGFGLIREVRNHPTISAIPIVLLSARAGEESRVEGFEAGADDYLIKPFSSQELVAKICALLRLGHLRMKYQEDRMYSVFMQISVGISVKEGPDHIYRLVNPTYMSTLLGKRDLLGKSIRNALPELESQGYFELLDQVYQTGKSYAGREAAASLKQLDGSIKHFYLDFFYEPKRSLTGEIEGILTVVNDVTERVLAKKNAEKLAEDLSRSLGVRDEFLSVASHELKTPVTSLKLQIQMAKRKVDPKRQLAPPLEKLADIFDISSKQIDRLARLIEDLLDVSRIQSGRLTCKFEPTSLKNTIGYVLERFANELNLANISVNLKIPENIVGNWDSSRIQQVMANFISNAIKYAAGTPLKISAFKKGEWIEISIRDYGIGVPVEKQTVIFERFERGITSKNISGLGLGLYIIRNIVESHGGTVQVKSVKGYGALFVIRLPVNPIREVRLA